MTFSSAFLGSGRALLPANWSIVAQSLTPPAPFVLARVYLDLYLSHEALEALQITLTHVQSASSAVIAASMSFCGSATRTYTLQFSDTAVRRYQCALDDFSTSFYPVRFRLCTRACVDSRFALRSCNR